MPARNGQARDFLLVANPRVLREASAGLDPGTLAGQLEAAACVETLADGANAARIADCLRERHPRRLVVAGGDGTVADAVSALMSLAPGERPALALLPFGTANNVARSLGIESIRCAGTLERARSVALGGRERGFDLGRAGDRHFAGSFAIGMDADILRLRNVVRAWLGEGAPLTGYPLYLASCAANLVLPHGGGARLTCEGAAAESTSGYCVLALNVSLYAGEFRFAAADPSDDGSLDLHVFDGALDYVRAYAAAWRRHLASGRGESVEDPSSRRPVRSFTIGFDAPVPAQLDGEELPAARRWEVATIPAALRVVVPGQSLAPRSIR